MNRVKLEGLISSIESIKFKDQSSFYELQSLIRQIVTLINEVGGRSKGFTTDLENKINDLSRPNLKSQAGFNKHKKETLNKLQTITFAVE